MSKEDLKFSIVDSTLPSGSRENGEQRTALLSSLLIVAHAITNDQNVAYQAVLRVLTDGLEYVRKKNEHLPTNWLYIQTIRKSRLSGRLASQSSLYQVPDNEIDRRLWPLIEKFDWRERLLCILHYCLEWSDGAVAGLLDVSESAVHAQLLIFKQRFKNALLDLPKENQAVSDQNLMTSDSIRRRYNVLDTNFEELEELQKQIEEFRLLEKPAKPQTRSTDWYLIGGIGLVVLLTCLIAGLVIAFIGIPAWQSYSSDPTPIATSHQPTSEAVKALPLTWLSSPDSIRSRMQNSSQFWQTIFIETQISDFGPASYIGGPRLYHILSWVKQPDESIQLFGLLSQDPNKVYVLTNGHNFELNPILNYSSSQEVKGGPDTLIENETLRQMIFPSVSPWSNQEGTLRVFDTDQILERDALIVDWFNSFGQHEARLWIDTEMGIILRLQEFGGPDSTMLLKDTVATEISLNQSFPPTRLASAMQKVSSSSFESESGAPKIIQPTPTPATPITQRQSPSVAQLPEGYNIPASELFFQFSNNLLTSNAITGTARVPVQVFADNHLVADTKFGLPWMLRCQRSPDGYRMAFNTGSDGTSTPDESLLWLDLRYPEQLYEPFPELQAQVFAFSPDSTQIAVFGHGPSGEQSGIYIIDLAKVENRSVINLPEVDSLVWSPDGESLALVGNLGTEDFQEAAVIHLRTGQISFRAPFPEGLRRIPESWPMSNWGVPFPQSTGTMDDCSRPVQK